MIKANLDIHAQPRVATMVHYVSYTQESTHHRVRFLKSCLVTGLIVASAADAAQPTSPPAWDGTIGIQKYVEFYATDIAVNSDGDFYYSDVGQNSVIGRNSDGSPKFKTGLNKFVRGVNLGPDGRLYVGQNESRDITVYDQTGRLVDTWHNVGEVNGEGAFASDGLLYLRDGNHVIVLDTTGQVLRRFSGTGSDLGLHTNLRDVAVASNGDIWTVNESNPPRIQKFSANGVVKLAFGSSGTGPGQFNTPVSISIDSQDNIYVSDRRNSRVQKFDSEGNFLLAWGTKGRGPGEFLESHGLFVADDDTVWVAGFHAYSVQQFDTEGNLLQFFNGELPGIGEFGVVTSVVVVDDVLYQDKRYDRVLYAVDLRSNRIHAMDPYSGAPLFEFGQRGQGPSTVFNFPKAIGQGPDKSLYISDDGHTRRISPEGDFIDIYSFRNQTGGQIVAGRGIDVTDDGVLYQANDGRDTIFTIDTKLLGGELVSEWGGPGDGSGLFNNLRSLAVAGNEVYVTDQQDKTVEVYSLHGDLLRAWPEPVPMAFGIDVVEKDDIVYVGSNGVIRAFDMVGTPLFTFGSRGEGPGQFGGEIQSVTVDSSGTVYATDTSSGRIHRFKYPQSNPQSPILYTGRSVGVRSDVWMEVTLPFSYINPVVVASVQRSGSSGAPVVARVRNASGNRFEIRVQEATPSGQTEPDVAYDVQFLVVDAGVYTQGEHGITMEAGTVDSTRTDGKFVGGWKWAGQTQGYRNAYTNPVVLGQVMSANDDRWSVFWALGSTSAETPRAGELRIGKHVGEDPDPARVSETIGYIILEAGEGAVGGTVYEAGVSEALVQGTGNQPPYLIPVRLAGSVTGAVVSAAGMRGGDGGWPVLYGPQASDGGGISVAFEEDQMSDAETWHIPEHVSYVVVKNSAN